MRSERTTRTGGFVFLAIAVVFTTIDVFTGVSSAPAALFPAFFGGMLLGRATEVAERRRGRGLR